MLTRLKTYALARVAPFCYSDRCSPQVRRTPRHS